MQIQRDKKKLGCKDIGIKRSGCKDIGIKKIRVCGKTQLKFQVWFDFQFSESNVQTCDLAFLSIIWNTV